MFSTTHSARAASTSPHPKFHSRRQLVARERAVAERRVLDQRGRRVQRLRDGQHRGQLLGRDAHEGDRLVGGLLGVGGDGGHRLAVELRLADGQHRTVLVDRPEARHRVGQVGGGDHGAHAGDPLGLAGVDRHDAGAGAVEGDQPDVQQRRRAARHRRTAGGRSPARVRRRGGWRRRSGTRSRRLLAARGAAARRRRCAGSRRSGTGCRRAPRGRPSAVGCGFSFRSAWADTTMPGMQKPHWMAPVSRNASCSAAEPGPGLEALDRGDVHAVGLDGQHEAGVHGPAVDEDGAGAALALGAALLAAGQGRGPSAARRAGSRWSRRRRRAAPR